MEATIKTNTELLNENILEGIRQMFPGKDVEITIKEVKDEKECSFEEE